LNRYNTWAFYFCLDHSYYFSPQNHYVLKKAEHICDLIRFRRNELKFSIHMPAVVLTIMYIMNHSCQLGPYLNSNKPVDLYKSLEMWSIGGLITRYQRLQFLIHIRRHQLGNVLRFHVAHFCSECACPWFFFKTQSNILWASILQHYRDTTIWHSTIAGTHHQTFHVAKKYLFKWQGWKGSHNIEPEDSQGLQKVDTNSILTSMVQDFHWSVQWSAHHQIHFRHKKGTTTDVSQSSGRKFRSWLMCL
jgi:hypothetical protein